MKNYTTTNSAQTPDPSKILRISFELAAQESESDYALINMIGQESVNALQQEGYTACPPAYTGQKGVESFLVDFIIVIQQIATTVWNEHVAIAESIADLSGLVTIFGGILPILQHMQHAHEKHLGNKESVTTPIKMTVEIDGMVLVIQASEITQADAALKLALKHFSMHPATAAQATTKSKIRVRGQVPTRKRRARR